MTSGFNVPKPRISIIGAGSAGFSLLLIRDICLTKNLAGSTVSLMDVDQERLDAAHTICQRYAEELGVQLNLEKTLDRRESLRDADFVINTALTTGHPHMKEGWEISLRRGYRWGASFHVMYDEPFYANYYQFRFFESVTEDMLELCPSAWHLLVANPVLAGVTHITRKYPQAKIIGLCHGFSGVYDLAKALGLDEEGLTFEIPGVNHFVWLTHCHYRGQDVFPMIERWIEDEQPKYEAGGRKGAGLNRKSCDLFRRFGAFPIGDTASITGASWPAWYHSDETTEQRWEPDPGAWWYRYNAECGNRSRQSIQIAYDHSLKLTEYMRPVPSGEVMVPIIESITYDIPRVIIGNIQNRGELVPGIPEDFEVEVPTLVSKRGIEGIRTLGLPKALLAHTLRDRVAPVNLELEAYNTGSRELLTQLVMMDPWNRSEEQAQGLIDEIFALPYHDAVRAHYR